MIEPRTLAFDSSYFDLAELFLSDEPKLEDKTSELAAYIQAEIEA